MHSHRSVQSNPTTPDFRYASEAPSRVPARDSYRNEDLPRYPSTQEQDFFFFFFFFLWDHSELLWQVYCKLAKIQLYMYTNIYSSTCTQTHTHIHTHTHQYTHTHTHTHKPVYYTPILSNNLMFTVFQLVLPGSSFPLYYILCMTHKFSNELTIRF